MSSSSPATTPITTAVVVVAPPAGKFLPLVVQELDGVPIVGSYRGYLRWYAFGPLVGQAGSLLEGFFYPVQDLYVFTLGDILAHNFDDNV